MQFSLATASIVLAYTATASAQIRCPVPNGNFCAGSNSNIIIRCVDGVAHPGNCNDNLAGEPPVGVKPATCYQPYAHVFNAACSKNGVVYPDNGAPFRVISKGGGHTQTKTKASTPTPSRAPGVYYSCFPFTTIGPASASATPGPAEPAPTDVQDGNDNQNSNTNVNTNINNNENNNGNGDGDQGGNQNENDNETPKAAPKAEATPKATPTHVAPITNNNQNQNSNQNSNTNVNQNTNNNNNNNQNANKPFPNATKGTNSDLQKRQYNGTAPNGTRVARSLKSFAAEHDGIGKSNEKKDSTGGGNRVQSRLFGLIVVLVVAVVLV